MKNDLSIIIQGQLELQIVRKQLDQLLKEKHTLNIGANLDLEKTLKGIEKLEKSFERLIAQADKLSTAIGDGTPTEKQAQQLEKIAEREAKLFQQKQEHLTQFMEAHTAMMDERLAAIDNLTQAQQINTDQLNQLIQQQISEQESLNDSIVRTGQKGEAAVESIAQALAAAGVVATINQIKQALWQAVDASMAFESALALVEKTTFSTAGDMAILRNEILQMSTEIPLSTTEIARIVEEAGRLGIEGTANILKFSDTMARLGATTVMSSADAARSIAGFAAVVGLPIEEVDKLGSALSLLGNNVAVGENQIMNFAQRMGSAGAAAGLTAYEILSMSAAFAHLQIPAEMGGSAVSRALNDITLAVATGNERLQDFARVAGMSAEQFARAWEQDAAEVFLQFIAGLDDVERHGAGIVQLLDEIGVTNLRISDSMRRAALSGEHLRDIMVLGADAFHENNSLMRESEIRFATTKSQMVLLANATNQLRMSFGDALLPAVNNTAGALEALTLHLANSVEESRWLVEVVTALTIGLGTGIGVIATYTMLVKALTAVKTAIASATGVATVATMGFSAALKASPLGPIAIALGLVAGGLTLLITSLSSASQRAEEARRITKELEAAHRAGTQTLYDYKNAFEEINNLRLDSSNAQETLEINENLLILQNKIYDSIGSQAEGIEFLERRRIELEKARTALQSGRADAESNLSNVEASQRGARDMVALENWRENMRAAQEILDSFNEGTTELHRNLERLAREQFQIILDIEYPDIAKQFFDPALAEQSAQAQKNSIVSIMNSLWDEYSWVFNEIADNPIEAVLLLRPDLDIDAVRENVARVVPELADELMSLLTFEELRLVINLDYESIERFTGGTAQDFANWVREYRQTLDEVAQQTNFEASIESLTSKINLLTSAMQEQSQTGRISQQTWVEVANAIEENANLLEFANGNLTILNAESLDYLQTLIATAIRQGIVNGYTEDMIAEFKALYQQISELRSEKEDLGDAITRLQSTYDVLTRAVEEYNETRTIEVGTLKDLLNLGAEYLDLLFDEEGQINLNADALVDLTKIRIEELALAQARSLVDNVRVYGEESSALRTLTSSTEDAASAMWELVFAEIAYLDIAEDSKNVLVGRVQQLQSLARAARENVRTFGGGSGGRSGGSGGRSGSTRTERTVEPFEAELRNSLLLDSRLGEISSRLAEIDRFFAEFPPDGQAILLAERISLLEEQKRLLNEIANIDRSTLQNTLDELANHGLYIEFDVSVNEFSFKQSVQEMQDIINSIEIAGDQEATNALRRELQTMLETIDSMRDGLNRNTEEFRNIQDVLRQINLDMINAPFAQFVQDAQRELQLLNRELE